jgi:hypothetical protein
VIESIMRIAGTCHCGNIVFSLILDPAPTEIPARVCTCSFCSKHGGVWTASPIGVLRVTINGPTKINRYAFGTRTAQFHICRECGIVPVVTSTIQGRDYAVVNVNTFDNLPEGMLNRTPVSFDGEGAEERLERRAKHWIPNVEYIESDT